jgi:HAD superfamily hydrolase (TIGR01509 family)
MIRAIAWDLDGVLLDSYAAHAEAFQTVLAARGVQIDYMKYIGLSTGDVFRSVLPDITEFEVQVLRHQKAAATCIAPMMCGALTILRRLYASWMPMAIVSSGEVNRVCEVVRWHGLDLYLKCIIGNDGTLPVKPAPDLYLKAFACLGVPASECLVVEDSIAGVRAGVAAGARVCGFRNSALLSEGAEIVLSSLLEVPVWIARNGQR